MCIEGAELPGMRVVEGQTAEELSGRGRPGPKQSRAE